MKNTVVAPPFHRKQGVVGEAMADEQDVGFLAHAAGFHTLCTCSSSAPKNGAARDDRFARVGKLLAASGSKMVYG